MHMRSLTLNFSPQMVYAKVLLGLVEDSPCIIGPGGHSLLIRVVPGMCTVHRSADTGQLCRHIQVFAMDGLGEVRSETGPVRHRQIDAALVRLGKQLRSLSSLALKVVSVQPLSAAARHTSAFAPLPHPFAGGPGARGVKVARCIDPLEVLVQLEGSGGLPLLTSLAHRW